VDAPVDVERRPVGFVAGGDAAGDDRDQVRVADGVQEVARLSTAGTKTSMGVALRQGGAKE
jgi:hypothetical protein